MSLVITATAQPRSMFSCQSRASALQQSTSCQSGVKLRSTWHRRITRRQTQTILDDFIYDRQRSGASSVEERSWIDPDFLERSLTNGLLQPDRYHFMGSVEKFDPSSFSHVIHAFVCKQIDISFGVLFVV